MKDLFPIDMRSDTVTRPSPEMRRVMAEAEVGDDVLGDDPTVNRLQEESAALLDKETALFVASGTMGNEVAIRALTEPGDEIICHRDSHIYLFEGGAPAALAGCSLRLVEGGRGIFGADTVRAAIRRIDSHCPVTRLVSIENTQNRGGGAIWPVETIAAIRKVADERGLRMHLDGARLMNACVATGLRPSEYTRYFDTVSICFSKGLGAPVGSILAGSGQWIDRAHRFRKMFGGGMRQAGIIAAGALYALHNNVDRLAEDHANARLLADGLAAMKHARLNPADVETNIVIFDIAPETMTAGTFCERLERAGVRMFDVGPQRVRAVLHLDVSREQVERALVILRELLD